MSVSPRAPARTTRIGAATDTAIILDRTKPSMRRRGAAAGENPSGEPTDLCVSHLERTRTPPHATGFRAHHASDPILGCRNSDSPMRTYNSLFINDFPEPPEVLPLDSPCRKDLRISQPARRLRGVNPVTYFFTIVCTTVGKRPRFCIVGGFRRCHQHEKTSHYAFVTNAARRRVWR